MMFVAVAVACRRLVVFVVHVCLVSSRQDDFRLGYGFLQ